MDVFKLLKSRVATHALKKPTDQLTIGQKYEVYQFVLKQSEYVDKKSNIYPMNLIAYIKDKTNRYFVTMPTLYNNLTDEQVKEMNEVSGKKTPPSIVYYGKDGNRNDVLIHEFDEEMDLNRLSEYLKKEDDPPAKKPRLDSASSSHSSFSSDA